MDNAPSTHGRRRANLLARGNAVVALALVILSGCAVKNYQPPNMGQAWAEHDRITGFKLKVPSTQANGSVMELTFGFASHVQWYLPVATNDLYAPPIADSFAMGDEFGWKSTVNIRERLQSGYKGEPNMAVKAPTFQELK